MKVEMQANVIYNGDGRTHVDNGSSPLSLPQWRGSGSINQRMENLMHFSYAMAYVVILILNFFCGSIFFQPTTKVKCKDDSRQVEKLLIFPIFRPKTYPSLMQNAFGISSLIHENPKLKGHLISITHKKK